MDEKRNTVNENQGGIGRTNFIDNASSHSQETGERDISSIDRQEGTMDHGTTGKDFNKEADNRITDKNRKEE
jgi:hypothetical protein